ncbi:hypothetical protein Tco_0085149 [Tanacetum coccineum]
MASSITRFDIEKLDGNIVQNHRVAQRRLEDKQLEERTNTNCFVKEQEKVHLGIKVGADITVTGVPGQEGPEGNVAGRKKRRSKEAKLGNLLMYKAWLTRRSLV